MEQMIEVSDGTVWADDTGGPGAPVVLLHPGIGDSRVWDPVMPRLAARYRVVRYDARGHGMSPPATAPYTLVEDLIMVLDHLEVARATLVGCSQGGASSIDLTLAVTRAYSRTSTQIRGLSESALYSGSTSVTALRSWARTVSSGSPVIHMPWTSRTMPSTSPASASASNWASSSGVPGDG